MICNLNIVQYTKEMGKKEKEEALQLDASVIDFETDYDPDMPDPMTDEQFTQLQQQRSWDKIHTTAVFSLTNVEEDEIEEKEEEEEEEKEEEKIEGEEKEKEEKEEKVQDQEEVKGGAEELVREKKKEEKRKRVEDKDYEDEDQDSEESDGEQLTKKRKSIV